MNKRDLSEADIKAKFITPGILQSGRDEHTQIGREIYFTDGRIYVKGKMTRRGKRKFADYILFYKPNVPIAIIEAKTNSHTLKNGIQQALGYANTLDIPFVLSRNGSPKPIFDTNEPERSCFVTEITIHPDFIEEEKTGDQAGGQVGLVEGLVEEIRNDFGKNSE